LGSEQATEIWESDKRFPVTIRLPTEARAAMDLLERMLIGEPE